jgi:hypothetical protein
MLRLQSYGYVVDARTFCLEDSERLRAERDAGRL